MLLFVFSFILLLSATPLHGEESLSASGSQSPQISSLCMEFTAKGSRIVKRRTCVNPGEESQWLWIGDDTGYRDQKLRITAHGSGKVCLRFTAVNSRGKLLDRGWVCSSSGNPSQQLWIGDDSGYRKQNLILKTDNHENVCIDNIRTGRRGERRTGWVCSRNNQPSNDLYLGDDSGYKNQRLKIRLPNKSETSW